MNQIKISLLPRGSDIFASQCDALVNPVNCVGVMGKGLALAFKKHYPEMFATYKNDCISKEISMGRPYMYHMPVTPHIICFPTKNHWREKSNLLDIECGLGNLFYSACLQWDINSIAIPALGCGEGGLLWEDVLPIIYKAINFAHGWNGGLEFVEIYPPSWKETN